MKVLIAIDGSHASRAAVSMVARRQWEPGTVLKLVTVLHEGTAKDAPEVDNLFGDALSILQIATSVQIEAIGIYGHGNIPAAILREAEEWHADLIVAGSRGHSLLEDMLIGSVSQHLIEKSNIPVMVAREVEERAFGNVIVSVGDCEASAGAIEWLADQSWAANATIALLSVAKNRGPDVSRKSVAKASEALLQWEHERGLLAYALEFWTAYLHAKLPNATIHSGVADGDPRELIVRAARNWPAECIVMGSCGREGLAELLLGSVSQAVSANAECSVVIARGVQSKHYSEVHALVEQHRATNPLLIEPSHAEYHTDVHSSPVMFW